MWLGSVSASNVHWTHTVTRTVPRPAQRVRLDLGPLRQGQAVWTNAYSIARLARSMTASTACVCSAHQGRTVTQMTHRCVKFVQRTCGARVRLSPRAVPTLTHLQGAVLRPIASALMAILDPTETPVWRVRRACGVREGWSRRAGLTLRQLP
jgi:hypothetical protein